jgi:hypothetical protein
MYARYGTIQFLHILSQASLKFVLIGSDHDHHDHHENAHDPSNISTCSGVIVSKIGLHLLSDLKERLLC